MNTICRTIVDFCNKPRSARARGAVIVLNLALISALSACPTTGDGDGDVCEPLTCDLACDNGFVLDADGCETCECVGGPDIGDGCYADADCGGDLVCNLSACNAAPGCEDGEACDAVCYGVCQEPLVICNDTAACGDGKICRQFSGQGTYTTGDQADQAAPCEPDEDGNCGEPTDPGGVCVPDTCGEGIVLLPNCPQGTQLALDFTQNPCGEAICVDVDIDDCRDLDPNVCESVPGCRLEELQAPCECGEDIAGEIDECVCPAIVELVCVADGEDCAQLDEQACHQSDRCYPEYYNHGGCGGEPAPCDADDANCAEDQALPPCEDYTDFVCLPYEPNDECYSDNDCAPGQRCEAPQACSVVCYSDDDGTEDCFEECWQETGVCVDGGGDYCYQLSPDECQDRPDCELQDNFITEPCYCDDGSNDCGCDGADQFWEPICVPVAPTTCGNDEVCPYGFHCEEEEICPPCDFENPDDVNCFAECWVEGRCVQGPPPPPTCDDSIDCGPGHACETVTVCEAYCYDGMDPNEPGDEDPNGDPAVPPPCFEECYEEAICVYVGGNQECFDDWDCGDNAYCDIDFQNCGGGMDPNDPDFLIACLGICVEIEPPDELCWNDNDCGPGLFCNMDNCAVPGDPNDPDFLIACLGVCEPEVNHDECSSDMDCGDEQFCAYEYCEDGPDGQEGQCYGRCYDVDPEPNDVCLADNDCSEGYRCATELDICACPNGDEYCYLQGECWSVCVIDNPPEGECFDDSDCVTADGQQGACSYDMQNCDVSTGFCLGFCEYDVEPTCVEDQECFDAAGNYGQCVQGQCLPVDCAAVETPAVDPDNGHCEVFGSACTPQGWIVVSECPGANEPCGDAITPASNGDVCIEFPQTCIPPEFEPVMTCDDANQP